MIKTILYNEWRKVRGGSVIFWVLLLLTGMYAVLVPSFTPVAVVTAVLLTMYTAFLARAFAVEQRHNQLPFQLGLPVSPRKVFLAKYLFGVGLLLVYGIAGLLIVRWNSWNDWFLLTWFYMPLVWVGLYTFLLMNSQWSEHGIAETVLLVTAFGVILAITCFTELFYCICIGYMMRTCALLQLILTLLAMAGGVWIRGIYRNMKRPWPLVFGYLVLILLPPLQFGLGIGINQLKLAYLENKMTAKGIELVDLPSVQMVVRMNIPVSAKEAELWFKHPDQIPVHRYAAQLLDLVEHNKGWLGDPLFFGYDLNYWYGTLAAHYLLGNDREFLRVFNYLRSRNLSDLLVGYTRGLFSLSESPLNNVEFYRRWHEAAARELAPTFMYNRNADKLTQTLRMNSETMNLYDKTRSWSIRAQFIRHYLRFDKPFFDWADPTAELIAIRLYHMEHGEVPEHRSGPFEYKRQDKDTFTLKTNQTIRIKLKETGK